MNGKKLIVLVQIISIGSLLFAFVGCTQEKAKVEEIQLPEYKIVHSMTNLQNIHYGEIVIESYTQQTPADVIEKTARQLSTKHSFDIVYLYRTYDAYKSNHSASYSEAHPGALKNDYLGFYDKKLDKWNSK